MPSAIKMAIRCTSDVIYLYLHAIFVCIYVMIRANTMTMTMTALWMFSMQQLHIVCWQNWAKLSHIDDPSAADAADLRTGLCMYEKWALPKNKIWVKTHF